MAGTLSLRGLRKRFGATVALDGVSLDVQPGELLCIVGPSGCGKTTLLRLVAGFERPDGGEVLWQGDPISTPAWVMPPERRRIGMVFQDGALFPHLTVWENIAFGVERAQAPERVEALLRLTGTSDLARRYPHELSGGQQQRVALARALAPRPNLLLLDEPFSNQDASLRRRIRQEVRDVLHAAGMTAILVTHDQEEAANLGDRLAVMDAGRIVQVGTPEEVMTRPATAFVAGFLGHNGFLPGRVEKGRVLTELGTFPLQEPASAPCPVNVLVQPEQVLRAGVEGVTALVTRVEFLAGEPLYTVTLPSGIALPARLPGGPPLHVGDTVPVRFLPDPLVVYTQEGQGR
jgi:iron(III) transport system ATP-binding protein